jgi:hypothetical protein
MPVSIEGRGSGVSVAARVAVELHEDQVPDFDEAPPPSSGNCSCSRPARRLPAQIVVDSEHGPQGPVSPICQKLSFSSRRKMRLLGTPATFCQSFRRRRLREKR